MLIELDTSETNTVILTLNRPEKRNALNMDLLKDLCNHISRIQEDTQARVIIIKGAGPVFCAGLDLKEAMDKTTVEQSSGLVARMLQMIHKTSLVTIAAVHGAALAGGAGLMSACDLVVVEESTKIAYPETRRGLVAGLVMSFLKRQVGERHMKELLLLADVISSQRAYEMGLVNRVVPDGEALNTAKDLARIVMKGAPSALSRTKVLIDELHSSALGDDLQRALYHHRVARHCPDSLEGMKAFLEKREPSWCSNK